MKKLKPRKSIRPHARLTDDEKARLVTKASALFAAAFPDLLDLDGDHGACMYWTACAIHVAHRAGIQLVPQAGSASFKRLRDSFDDGVVSTHFSFMWDRPSPAKLAALLNQRMLPEMHVWAGDPSRQEVIDLTTASLPAQCKAMTGEDWMEVAPPPYLWSHELPDGWRYEPLREPTLIAVKLMEADALPKIIEAERSGRVVDLDTFKHIKV